MGLFGAFKNKIELHDLEYAEDLFSTLCIGAPASEEAKKFSNTHDRQEVLEEVIRISKQYNSPHGRYLTAIAYAWSRVAYRKEAIKYLNDYLNGEPYTEGAIHRFYHYYEDKNRMFEESLSIQQSSMYGYLGKAYEGEYMFENALKAYEKADELNPMGTLSTLLPICEVLIKMGDIDKAIKILKNKKLNHLTGIELTQQKKLRKNQLEIYGEKKKKGYVYKPRRK